MQQTAYIDRPVFRSLTSSWAVRSTTSRLRRAWPYEVIDRSIPEPHCRPLTRMCIGRRAHMTRERRTERIAEK